MNSTLQELLKSQVDLDSLVKDLIKDFLETLLKAELTERLNYEKYDIKAKTLVTVAMVTIVVILKPNMVKLKLYPYHGIVTVSLIQHYFSPISVVITG